MFSASPPSIFSLPEASTLVTLLPPPPSSAINSSTSHIQNLLTSMGGFMFVSVVCALIVFLMCMLHHRHEQEYRTRFADIEASFEARQIAQLLNQLHSVRARQQTSEVHAATEEASVATAIAYKEIEKGELIDRQGECAICIEGFEEEEMCRVIESCRHFFHKDCIDQWLMIESRCPLCRCFVLVVVSENPHESQA